MLDLPIPQLPRNVAARYVSQAGFFPTIPKSPQQFDNSQIPIGKGFTFSPPDSFPLPGREPNPLEAHGERKVPRSIPIWQKHWATPPGSELLSLPPT